MAALPLDNRRIIITRPEDQAGEMAREIRRLGGIPVLLPMIRILPMENTAELDGTLRGLEMIDAVVFTSANAVSFLMERAKAIGVASSGWDGKEVYAVGSKTAAVAREYALNVALIPGRFSGAELAKHLTSRNMRGKRVLFPRGDLGRDEALQAAEAAGAEVVPVVVYRTVGPEESVARRMREELLEGPSAILVFASPSAVRHTAQLFTGDERARLGERVIVAAIGPTTRDAVLFVQWPVRILPDEATGRGLVSAIAAYVHTHSYA